MTGTLEWKRKKQENEEEEAREKYRNQEGKKRFLTPDIMLLYTFWVTNSSLWNNKNCSLIALNHWFIFELN